MPPPGLLVQKDKHVCLECRLRKVKCGGVGAFLPGDEVPCDDCSRFCFRCSSQSELKHSMLDIDRARELACPVMTSWIRQQRRHQPTAPLDVEQILREHGGAEELRVTTPSGGGSTSHHGKHPIDTWSGDFSSLDDESACVVRPLEFEITQDVYHNWVPSAETQELLNSPTELPQDGSQIYDYLTPEGSFSASDVQQSYANAGNAAWYQPGPSFNEEITDMICSPEFDALLDSGFISDTSPGPNFDL